MQITTRTWNNYIARLSRLNEAAGQKMREYIQQPGTENTEELISYAYAVITRYGEGSAELACQMYDALAEAEGMLLPLPAMARLPAWCTPPRTRTPRICPAA